MGETIGSAEPLTEQPTGFVRLKPEFLENNSVGRQFPDELLSAELPLFEDFQHPRKQTIYLRSDIEFNLNFFARNRHTLFVEDPHVEQEVVMVRHSDVVKVLKERAPDLAEKLGDDLSDWWVFSTKDVEYQDLRNVVEKEEQ